MKEYIELAAAVNTFIDELLAHVETMRCVLASTCYGIYHPDIETPDRIYQHISDYISDGQIVIRNRLIPKLLSQMESCGQDGSGEETK